MRLFIGIHLSKSQRRAIARAQADLKRQGVTGRFTPEENLHLTLAFLGECDSNQRDTVVRVLKKTRFAPFHLKLSQSGRFGDTIWAAPDNEPRLVELADHLRQALDRAGIAYDRKPFKPHITMLRKAKSAGAFYVHLDRSDGVVTRVALIQSELGTQGPRYSDIFTVDDRGRTWRRKPDTPAKRHDPRQQIFKSRPSASSGKNRHHFGPSRLGGCGCADRRHGQNPHL
jgi:2'-5' RNA ligase